MAWLTYLHVTEKDEKWKEVMRTIEDIQAKDPTFKHRISKGGEIAIVSADKDIAFKRGGWFRHKFEVKYTVVASSEEHG